MLPRSSWSFLVDENTSRTLVVALRSVGYSAQHVYDAHLQGHPDSEVYSYAQMHEQIIITIDREGLDFPLQGSPVHSEALWMGTETLAKYSVRDLLYPFLDLLLGILLRYCIKRN